MTVESRIAAHIASQPGPKRDDLLTLHDLIRQALPQGKLWFLDGRNDQGKIVTNPSIGYGEWRVSHADGTGKDFYRIGLSANTSGISVYIMGMTDKTHLARTYADRLGKASVTGYCIRFKSLKDIDIPTLLAAIRDGASQP